MTGQTRTDEMAPLAARTASYRSWLARFSGWLRTTLYPERAGGRLGWRPVTTAVVLVAAGAAVSLSRTEGPGSLNTTWIEDGNNFLQDALHQSVMTTLTTQMNGYYDVLPRIVTAIAVGFFPLSWVPGIMSAAAAVAYALFGLIAYIASAPFLRSPWLRLLIAAPACMIPLGYTQANNDLATVQFIALFGMFWLLLWRPATRAGQVVAPLLMLGTTLSSILPVLLAPLVAARLLADRTKTSVAVAVCWAAGLVTQLSVQLRGLSNRTDHYTSPLWVLGQYFTRVIPRAIFGELGTGGPGTNGEGHPLPLSTPNVAVHDALVWGACAIVILVVILGLARRTAPTWPLAVTAFAFSVVLFLGEIVDNLTIVQPRYVIAPALLLYTAIVSLLRPRSVAGDAATSARPDGEPGGDAPATVAPRRGWPSVAAWLPVTVFALLLAVVVGFNFRVVNNRSESPPWTSVVAAATQTCQKPGMADYLYRHAWWRVQIPCSRV